MPDSELASWEGQSKDHWRCAWHAGEVHFFESVTSTNDVAARIASAGAPNLSVVIADEQTHGRGRAGSVWFGEPGTSLLLSVIFRVAAQGVASGCAPLRIGLAVAESIDELTGATVCVKWPNDVLMPGHGKIAGVLCEGAFGAERGGYIVAGIGINVAQSPEYFPAELAHSASSILAATARQVARSALVTRLLHKFGIFSLRITDPLTDDEADRFARRDVLYRLPIVCETGSADVVRGIARGITKDGALLIEQAESIRPVYNGTVRLAESHAYPGSGRG